MLYVYGQTASICVVLRRLFIDRSMAWNDVILTATPSLSILYDVAFADPEAGAEEMQETAYITTSSCTLLLVLYNSIVN